MQQRNCGSENLVHLSLAASLIGGAWRYKGGTVDGFSGGVILSGHTETETWQHCIILESSEYTVVELASRARQTDMGC